jgi:hypothetical protein
MGTVSTQQLSQELEMSIEDVVRILQELFGEKYSYLRKTARLDTNFVAIADAHSDTPTEVCNSSVSDSQANHHIENQILGSLSGATNPTSVS